ncbi:hypothetical protein [Hansschlegelia zhihuaiae]|uniref:hypothetical protein n=1 Tax=Hansschlegelia zhihuaiae TaxID=405005 RepID=UPI0013E8E4A0|nr:hypothetical protein [Hansschlegelia zhihuaiae]
MTNSPSLRRAGAAVLGCALALTTLAPTAAEAGRRHYHRHHHHNDGAVAAAVGIGILGVAAAAAAANARERECWYERRRVETPSGRVVLRRIKVCD